MKKNIFLKILCIVFILIVMFFSSRLAFASEPDNVTYKFYFQLDDTKISQIYKRFEKWETTVTCSSEYKPFLYIYRTTHKTYGYSYNLSLCLYKDGKLYRNGFVPSTSYSINGSLVSSNSNFGGAGGYCCYSSNLGGILSTSVPYYFGTSDFSEGISINVDNVIGGGLDFISGNNYNKNGLTNYSSDIYYPVPISIGYFNDNTDSVNYDKFRLSFDVAPETSRYSNISNYDLELWVLDSDRRIYVKSYPLASLQIQGHSGGGSWGDNSAPTYYILEDKLHSLIPYLDELGNPLTLEFRLVYKINDSSYLESGYVDINLDLSTGKVNSVNYYPDGMDENGTNNENQVIVPEVVQPSNPNQYIFNIDWENSNLDDFVRQNFGIKNYIIALKDTLSFLPDFFWTIQFFLLGAISSIGIYKLVIK